MTIRWNARHALFWIIIGNLVLRGLWLLYMHPPQQFDFLWYFTHAVQMAHGDGYRIDNHYTAYWPMGYPFFLSLLIRIFGSYVLPGLIANVLLSVGIVVLVFGMAHRLTGRVRLASIAAIAYSVLPSQIEWNSVLGSEELFTFLLLLSLYLYMLGETRRKRAPWNLAAGFVMGAACMVRPIPMLFPFVLLIYQHWIRKDSWKSSIWQAFLFGIGCLVGLCPLTLRNAIAMHHFILISTNGGVNLWQGTKASGSYFWSWDKHVNPLLAAGKNEIMENQIGEHAFAQFVLHHPFLVLWGAVRKWFFLYWVDWNVVGVTFQAVALPMSTATVRFAMWFDTVVYWGWMFVAGTGIWTVFRKGHRLLRTAFTLPLLFIAYNTLVFSVFPAWDRFRYPLMPLFALFFAWGWVRWINRREFGLTFHERDCHGQSPNSEPSA